MSTEQTTAEKKPIEVAVDPVADTEIQPTFTPPAAEPEPAGDDDAAPRVPGGFDRLAIGRKAAKRRVDAGDDVPFTTFADPALRGGSAIREQPDEPEPAKDTTTETPEARASGPSDSGDPKPAKRVIKVRGEEREVDDTELTRLAQIGAAGESYLTEAKSTLTQAEERLRTVKGLQHPEGTTTDASAARTEPGTEVDPQHPADDIRQAVERIQYGTPEEAAEAFQSAITKAVKDATNPQEARKQVYLHHAQLDRARSQTAFETFAAKPENSVLIKDPNAETVMQRLYYDEVRADLKKLGMPEDQIPQDRDRLVETHRFHRVNGQPVRDTSALLDASKQGFMTWKGGQKDPTPAPAMRKVEVKLDRTQRRSAIPSQPQRATAPAPAASAQSVPQGRKAAVDKLLANRRRAVVT